MIETCACIPQLHAIAAMAAHTRLSLFVMGVNDLAKEMRAKLTPERTPFLPFLASTVAAARAHRRRRAGRRVQRIPRSRCVPRRGGAGPAVRLRRQDADPPGPDCAVQCRVLTGRGGIGLGSGGDRRLSRCPRTPARAPSRWRARWPNCCIWNRRGGWWFWRSGLLLGRKSESRRDAEGAEGRCLRRSRLPCWGIAIKRETMPSAHTESSPSASLRETFFPVAAHRKSPAGECGVTPDEKARRTGWPALGA